MANQPANQKDWRETHFGVPVRPYARKRRSWWPWLITLTVVALAGVVAADRFGVITLPSWWRSTAQDLPMVGSLLVPPAAGNAVNTAEAATRERQLRERVSSRERGISLMSRERAEVLSDLAVQERIRDEATARLRSIENTSTSGMSATQIDHLRVAHSNAVAAAKNATLRARQLSDRRDSLNRRIATAESERDAALVDLGVAPSTSEEATSAP
jgi:hypothetical protein